MRSGEQTIARVESTHATTLFESDSCLFIARQSYEVVIVSPSFEGKSTLKRHREGQPESPPSSRAQLSQAAVGSELTSDPANCAVNELLKAEIAELHAFTQVSPIPSRALRTAPLS